MLQIKYVLPTPLTLPPPPQNFTSFFFASVSEIRYLLKSNCD